MEEVRWIRFLGLSWKFSVWIWNFVKLNQWKIVLSQLLKCCIFFYLSFPVLLVFQIFESNFSFVIMWFLYCWLISWGRFWVMICFSIAEVMYFLVPFTMHSPIWVILNINLVLAPWIFMSKSYPISFKIMQRFQVCFRVV